MNLSLGLGLGIPSANVTFSPARLFIANEPGFWGEVAPAYLWQDTARTTPVTADGDPVASWQLNTATGVIYATQSTAGNRPIYKTSAGLQWLEFDGATSNRWLQTPAINFSVVDKITLVAGVRKTTDAEVGLVAELGSAPTTAAFLLYGKTNGYDWFSRGSISRSVGTTSFPAPITNVLTGLGDIANDVCTLRVNAAVAAAGALDQGTGNFRNDIIWIGRRQNGTLPLDGRIYGLILRGAASSADDIARIENWMNQRTRAY